jgi:peptidoglycan-associated lipoprotein
MKSMKSMKKLSNKIAPIIMRTIVSASLLALSGCASNVRLDDLPSVESRLGNNQNGQLNNGGANGVGGINTGNAGLGDGTGGVNGNTNGNSNGGEFGNGANITTVQTNSSDTAQPTDAELAKRSVYFGYDSFAIPDNFKSVLETHAKYLNSHRNQSAALEGHTDERGGREYNLALGQKRAMAVQRAMQLLGVPDSQLEAVSFGKEKPRATGSTEDDYAENRRVDIQYK